MDKMTIEQFGATIKQKYPEYSSYSDSEIGQRMLQKYPQYTDRVNSSSSTKLGQAVTNIGKDILGVQQNKSQSFIPSILKSTIGSEGLAGVAQLPGRVAGAISEYGLFGKGGQHQGEQLNQQATQLYEQATNLLTQARNETDPNRQVQMRASANDLINSAKNLQSSASDIGQYTNTTGGQALGTALNAGLTAVTSSPGGANLLGNVSPAFQTLQKGTSFISPTAKAIYQGGRIAENAALGVGYNTASNLVNDRPITDNIGTSAIIGGAIPVAGSAISGTKNAIQKSLGSSAEGIINSLIKPLAKDFGYGKNPAQGILKEKIVANNFEDLAQKVNTRASEIGQRISAVGSQIDNTGVKLNLNKALTPIDEAIQGAAKMNNDSLFKSLNRIKDALTNEFTVGSENGVPSIVKGGARDLSSMTYNQAKDFLSNIAEHTRFTGNPSDDKALNMATKKAYGIARSIMNTEAKRADSALGQEIVSLNRRYADINSARNAINHRDLVLKRQNIFNLAEKYGIQGSMLASVATGLITGDYQKAGIALLAGLGGTALSKISGSTSVKTRVARFLASLAPEERQGIFNSTPVLKEYYQRITGNTSVDSNAPKTKALEALTNPSAGLSTKAIDFSSLHPDDQAFLNRVSDRILSKSRVTDAEVKIAQDTLEKYGFNVPKSIKKMADFIRTASNSSQEKTLFNEMDKNVQKGGIQDYLKSLGL